MAKLYVMGDWIGPGEERTANFLKENLPNDFFVVAGRKLPGKLRTDVDLIVIGMNEIFVLEEKSWGPYVEAGDVYWKSNSHERKSPMDGVTHKAKEVAGLLTSRIPDYKNYVAKQKVVSGGLIMSHPDLVLVTNRYGDDSELIMKLSDSTVEIMKLDTRRQTKLSTVRDSVLKVLTELPSRDAAVTTIGPYKELRRDVPIGRAYTFIGVHEITNQEVLLRCYPRSEWGDGDPTQFFLREFKALQRVEGLGRTWACQPPIIDEARDWFVVPIVSAKSVRNLADSIKNDDPQRVNGILPIEVALSVVEDAFAGLATLNAESLVHRIICPERIWLDVGMRVKFSDLYLARITGDESIILWAESDPISEKYRAPEVGDTLVVASHQSDIYSLALSLAYWMKGSLNAEFDTLQEWLGSQGELGQILLSCLNDEPAKRSTATQVAGLVKAIREQGQTPPDETFIEKLIEPGVLIANRYEIIRKLGEGGSAVSWLADDRQRVCHVVLKHLKSEDVAKESMKEFKVAAKISVRGCARVWDINSVPAPGIIVHEYIEGQSLKDRVLTEPLSTDLARLVTLEILGILEELHSQDIVHADLNAGNVIVGDDWTPTLIDFGLAAAVGADPRGFTPATAAPEVRQRQPLSVQSDLYSLASTILLLMLGRPLTADSSTVKDGIPFLPIFLTPAERIQWLPDGTAFMEALFEALAPNPAERPPSAKNLADKIRRSLGVVTPDYAADPSVVNPVVNELRSQYRGSRLGNANNRGLDTAFAVDTYVPTNLDTVLVPAILNGNLDLVCLTGNPGDGKTSFLVALRKELLDDGGQILEEDEAGWTIKLNGRTFTSVYDASESHEHLSSDELVHKAIDPLLSGNDHTALLAINDGRLLQFFTDYTHEFEELAAEVKSQVNEKISRNQRIEIIDLKSRSLSDFQGLGLAQQIIQSFTNPKLWETCNKCIAQSACPIYENVAYLRSHASDAIAELVLTSHLRRRRRATIRDFRSALAYVITGDRSCDEIKNSLLEGQDLRVDALSMMPDLVFDAHSADYLVQEWSELDPGRIIAPLSERFLREDPLTSKHLRNEPDLVLRDIRSLFMNRAESDSQYFEELRSYRYFDEYVQALQSPSVEFSDRLLLGMSRMIGSPGFSGKGLGIGETQIDGLWSVIKVIESNEFEIVVNSKSSQYIESIPDSIILRHTRGSEMVLTLDSAEMILRCADGEILGDVDSEAVKREVASYAQKLLRQRVQEVIVVDPTGVPETISLDQGKLIRRPK